MPPSAILTMLVDEALDAIEPALAGMLVDVTDRRPGEVPPYDDWHPSLVTWAPVARVRLGEASFALRTTTADVEQLVALEVASSRDAPAVHSLRTVIRRHAIITDLVREWLDLAKSILAEQRGQPVNPRISWERAWRARDEWDQAARPRH